MTCCEGCGTELPASLRGRPRKWCSERCRKSQYDLACVDCGGRVDGTTPSKLRSEPVCGKCAPAHYRVWTREAVVFAMHEWADEYGVPPAASDWNRSHLQRSGLMDRYTRTASGCWPCVATVLNTWGTWNAAIEAAGFEARPHGGWRYGRDGEDPELCREVRARYDAGESSGTLAQEYGCTPSTICYRIRKAGGSIRSHAEAQALRRERAAA